MSSTTTATLTADGCVAPPAFDSAARIDPEQLAPQVAALVRWFGAEFSLLDGATGDILHAAASGPEADWGYRGQLCRELAQRKHAEFLEDEDPLLTLGIPLRRVGQPALVAVSSFLTRRPDEADLERLAAKFRNDLAAARRWAGRQTPIAGETLLRLSELFLSQQLSDARIAGLESEVEKLSVQLAAMYEEISLIFRLTQNLNIARKEQELGKLALEWLVDIMPFEGMAMQLLPLAEESRGTNEREPLFLTHGHCPLDNAGFSRLREELGLNQSSRPVVLNRSVTDDACWPFPQIRELIVVPVGEGEQLFGWLAAFNHTDGGEFGTVEAGLLSSVSAILGIHGGNAELYRQQAELLSGIVRALTSAIDAKDPYTCGHSDRVARVAVRLAQELGCDEATVETIYLSGLLHDVGKIGIDDQVLRKPGKLTPAEFEHIKTHAQIGYNILVDLKQLGQVLPVVLHHHEAWDGTGYPSGLSGTNIPELARIVAVADAFDAMGSDRPYRKGMPDDKLDEIIRNGAGRQWDPKVVEAYFRAREEIRCIAKRDADDTFELTQLP
jgi:hypothetical protein